ncbi:MAG: hypothetical protein QF462_11215, partial [Myxococcota bacterium]|nr:hypothetical protein [Myxococcota bacterium]
MLRLILTFFATLGLLAGATLFFGTEAEVLRVGESFEPVVDRAVELGSKTARRLEEQARAVAVPPEREPVELEPEVVNAVRLDTRRGEPFVEGPLPEESGAAGPDASEVLEVTPPDQEEWAGRI